MLISEYVKTLKNEIKPRTVVFLVKDTKVLLGLKKKGFGKGYYIGIGGKVENNETIEDAAIREVNEEIHVSIAKDALKKVAMLRFYFPHISDESWNQEVHAYIVNNWEGDVSSSDEIEPIWCDIANLPLDTMWDDAAYWIPKILRGQKVYEAYLFDKNLKVTNSQVFKVI